MGTFHLKIIAYDKIFFDSEAESIVLPAIDGEVQILANHEECVIALKEGEVRIGSTDGKMIPAVCGSGFAEVNSDNQVEILVDTDRKSVVEGKSVDLGGRRIIKKKKKIKNKK